MAKVGKLNASSFKVRERDSNTENEKFPKVAIIILNWNGWKDTIECLESLYRIDYPNYDVVVVDNGSKDDSIKKIKDYAKGLIKVKSKYFNFDKKNKPIKILEFDETDIQSIEEITLSKEIRSSRILNLIKNKGNYGFAKGNNIGISFCIKKLKVGYVIILNNDTVVDKNFVSALVKSIQKRKNAGSCGSKMLLYDQENILNFNGALFSFLGRGHDLNFGEKDTTKTKKEKITGITCGGAMIIKSTIFEKIGGFDEDYFAYHEDTSLAWKLWLYGYKQYFVPTSIVYHKFRGSWNKLTAKRLFYGIRNRQYNIIKFFSFDNMIVASLLHFLFIICEFIHYFKISPKYILSIVNANISIILNMKILLKKRKDIQHYRKISDKKMIEMGIMLSFKDTFIHTFIKN